MAEKLEQSDYTSVQRRLQSVLPANDDSRSARSGTVQANEESSGNPITLIIPEAIGTEEVSQAVSTIVGHVRQKSSNGNSLFGGLGLVKRGSSR